MKHPSHVPGWDGSLKELAINVASMRYDKVAEFLKYFAQEINKQAKGDLEKSRAQLGGKLLRVSFALNSIVGEFNNIWRLCKPHMNKDNNHGSEEKEVS